MANDLSQFSWTHKTGLKITSDFFTIASFQNDNCLLLNNLFSKLTHKSFKQAQGIILTILDIALENQKSYEYFEQKCSEINIDARQVLLRGMLFSALSEQPEKTASYLLKATEFLPFNLSEEQIGQIAKHNDGAAFFAELASAQLFFDKGEFEKGVRQLMDAEKIDKQLFDTFFEQIAEMIREHDVRPQITLTNN